jgi:acetyltransferase
MLDPASIAVVGASANPTKRGHRAVAALLSAGFKGTVHPINPNEDEILGLPVLRNLADLPGPVDVALVATPAKVVPAVLRDAAAAGVAGVVILAVGFSESGEVGRALELEIFDIAATTGLRVIGPNTSGIFNTHAGINLVGVPGVPTGPISIISQSGNMLLSILQDTKAVGGPGFATYVGVGNQTDVQYHELVAALGEDPPTRAIEIHCEGFVDGRKFLQAVAKVTRRKPVVLLKGGTSEAGRRSALSHTGALAGSAVVTASVLEQAGVEVVQRSDELAVITSILATAPRARGDRIAVLADGGGHATLAADAVSSLGLPLATLALSTQAALRSAFGAAAAVGNPVDVAGATDSDPSLFTEGARVLLADDQVDILLIVGLFGGYQVRFGQHLADQEHAAAETLVAVAAASSKPMIVQSCYAGAHTAPHVVLSDHAVPVVGSIDHAARACLALARRSAFLASGPDRSYFGSASPSRPEGSRSPATLTEPEGRALLVQEGLAIDGWLVVHSTGDAETAVRQVGGPAALKVIAPQIVHKSDVGGVRTDVLPGTAGQSYLEILSSVALLAPDAHVEGVLVTAMAVPGVELLIGGMQDPTFGPVLAFGPGGTLVELLNSTAFRAAPITLLEADELMAARAVSHLLDGYRGGAKVDRSALGAFLVNVSQLLAKRSDILELDLNPTIAVGTAITPVDVRVIVNATQPGPEGEGHREGGPTPSPRAADRLGHR